MALVKSETGVERQKGDLKPAIRAGNVPVVSLVLGMLAGIGILASIWMIFYYAPVDAIQGLPQLIFYFHVPMAWVGMLAFVVVTVAGIAYLWKKDERFDWLARASAEVGAVFLTIALVLGSIWGKTIWGTWWSWDPKLTATLILWFIYVAYLMLRSYMGRTDASARSAAVLAIVGVVDVPIIYEAANWWRTLHPLSEAGLPTEGVLTLLVALLAFTLLYSFLMIQLYQLQKMQTMAQRMRAMVEEIVVE